MRPLIADAGVVELLVPAGAVIAGVLLGGFLPHFLSRRRDAQARYDRAISAVTRLQSARQGITVNIPAEVVKARSSEELSGIEQELSIERVRRFLEAAAEARAAVAELYPFSPDLRGYWSKFEISDSEVDGLVGVLMKRRRRPTKRHADLPRQGES